MSIEMTSSRRFLNFASVLEIWVPGVSHQNENLADFHGRPWKPADWKGKCRGEVGYGIGIAKSLPSSKMWYNRKKQPSKVCLAKLHGYLILLTFEKVVVFMIQNQRQNERIVSNFQIVMKQETRNLSFGVTTYYYTWHLSFTSPPTGLFTLATSITKDNRGNFLPLL